MLLQDGRVDPTIRAEENPHVVGCNALDLALDDGFYHENMSEVVALIIADERVHPLPDDVTPLMFAIVEEKNGKYSWYLERCE